MPEWRLSGEDAIPLTILAASAGRVMVSTVAILAALHLLAGSSGSAAISAEPGDEAGEEVHVRRVGEIDPDSHELRPIPRIVAERHFSDGR
jgi:hypothetical protein